MSDYLDKQKSQLGMHPSTARSRLDRIIMLHLITELKINTCFRCGLEITNVESLSVEHKIEWLDSEDAALLYFDLNNIAFSHNKCNSGARRYTSLTSWNKDIMTHGLSGYRLGCRCQICKSVYSSYRKDKYKRLKT